MIDFRFPDVSEHSACIAKKPLGSMLPDIPGQTDRFDDLLTKLRHGLASFHDALLQ
jgi:hypothetical protein